MHKAMPGRAVTVVIPTIPPRVAMLNRALRSVFRQEHEPYVSVSITKDTERHGSAWTRNEGLRRVTTPWTAFLDDDDELLPNHLATLVAAAEETGADVVYSGCRVLGADGREIPRLPEWGRFGLPFDPDLLRQRSYLPVTSLVRTEMARDCGGFRRPEGSIYDDWGFYLAMLDAGAQFHHVPEVTWIWHHHGANTSGLPERW